MRAIAISKAEQSVDRAASAIFAGACAYAAYIASGLTYRMPIVAAAATAAGVAAFLVTARALRAVEPEARKAPLSVFDLRSFESMESDELLLIERLESDELLLTETYVPEADENPFERAERRLLEHYRAAEQSEPAIGVTSSAEEPLLLDDILAELEPDSRVVRLFDPDAMPTPAQLRSRIDRHLEPGGRPDESPDATQALHEALADLRRSIR